MLNFLRRLFQSEPDPRCQEIRDRLRKLPPFRVNGKPVVTMDEWYALQRGQDRRA